MKLTDRERWILINALTDRERAVLINALCRMASQDKADSQSIELPQRLRDGLARQAEEAAALSLRLENEE